MSTWLKEAQFCTAGQKFVCIQARDTYSWSDITPNIIPYEKCNMLENKAFLYLLIFPNVNLCTKSSVARILTGFYLGNKFWGKYN